MFIHVKLRQGRDEDIIAWYEAQTDKSEAVRKAIRAYLRLQNGDTQEAVIGKAVSKALAGLPDLVAAAVRNALTDYQLAPAPERESELGEEDPELAARLDAQLDEFFGS